MNQPGMELLQKSSLVETKAKILLLLLMVFIVVAVVALLM